MPKVKPLPADIESRLTDADFNIRAEAVKELGTTNNLEAIPLILSLIEDKTVTVRAKVAQALKKFYGKDERVIESLVILSGDVHGVHKWVFNFLLEQDAKPLVPKLLTSLKHEKSEVRKSAMHLLAYLEPESLIPELPALLNDSALKSYVIALPSMAAAYGKKPEYQEQLSKAISAAQRSSNA